MSIEVRMIPRNEIGYWKGVTDESNAYYPWAWVCDTDGVPMAIQIADECDDRPFEDRWINPGPVLRFACWSKKHNAAIYVADDGSVFRLIDD